MEAVMSQEPHLFQKFSLVFSEIFSINERLQLLGTEAWFVVKEIRNKCGLNENIEKFEELAKLASNGLEMCLKNIAMEK